MDNFEIEIFKAGKRTASNGIAVDFGVSNLHEIASTYDPAIFKAPLIVSHNTKGHSDRTLAESELAFGFPKSLRVAGDRLKAVFDKDKVVPQIVDWFRQGRLLSVSSSFYQPNSPHNPTPGKYYLRHIAALGKTPPAVKGLATIDLSEELRAVSRRIVDSSEESKEEWLCFEQEATEETLDFDCGCEDGSTAEALQAIREWIIGEKGVEKADAILPRSLIKNLEGEKTFWMRMVDDLGDRLNHLQMQISQLQIIPSEPPLHSVKRAIGEVAAKLNYKEGTPKKMMDLQKMMDEAGMEAADVAEATGIDEEELTMYVSGKKKPSAAKLKRIKDALGGESENKMDYSEEIDQLRRQLQLAEIEAQTARREAELARNEAEQSRIDQQRAAERGRLTAIASFCEGLERDGLLLPRQTGTRALDFGEDETSEMGLVEFMQSLDEEQLAFAQEFLSDLAPQVDYSERAKSNGHVEDAPKKSKIKLPSGHAVNSQSEELFDEVLSYCESNGLDPNNSTEWSKAVKSVISARSFN